MAAELGFKTGSKHTTVSIKNFEQVQQALDQTWSIFSLSFTQSVPRPHLRVLRPLNLQL